MRYGLAVIALAIAPIACQDRSMQDRGITGPSRDVTLATTDVRPVYEVIGGGSVVREDIQGAPREVYGFHARVDAAGRVTGEAEVHFPSDAVSMHIDVQCLVVDRNQAWLSGPVTRSDDPATPPGRVFVWQVQDNGNGSGAAPDRVSSFRHRPADNYPPDVCMGKPALTTFPWDNGSVTILTPGALGLSDLVGTWDATLLFYVNPEDPADTVRLSGDQAMRWTVAPNGRFSMVWWLPGSIWENVSGSVDVVNGEIAGLGITGMDWRVTGSGIYGEGDVEAGYDWDGDGEDDPSHVVMEWRRLRTGVLPGDVAGTWDASQWRYTSLSNPAQVVDLAGNGAAVTLLVGLDSRYDIAFTSGLSNAGDLLFDGSQLLVRAESAGSSPPQRWPDPHAWNGSRAFTFALAASTWSFAGPDTYDFDENGTGDPATLEVVLVRR